MSSTMSSLSAAMIFMTRLNRCRGALSPVERRSTFQNKSFMAASTARPADILARHLSGDLEDSDLEVIAAYSKKGVLALSFPVTSTGMQRRALRSLHSRSC